MNAPFLVPFEAAKLHVGIRKHFTEKKYDFFKYKGGVKNYTTEVFAKMNARMVHAYNRLARKYDAEQLLWFYVANAYVDPSTWVGDLTNPEHHEIYLAHVGRMKNMTYIFSEYLTNARETYGDLDRLITGDPPPLIRALAQKIATPETVIMLNAVFDGKLWNVLDRQISDTLLWPKILLRLRKYELFLDLKPEPLKDIVRNALNR